jgi:hypothetical protein
MVTQYFWPWNNRIDEVVDFMKLHKINFLFRT